MLTERSGSCWSITGRRGSAGIVDDGGAVEVGKALLRLGESIGCGGSAFNGGACGSISAASMSRENGMRGEVITAWGNLGDSLMGARGFLVSAAKLEVAGKVHIRDLRVCIIYSTTPLGARS